MKCFFQFQQNEDGQENRQTIPFGSFKKSIENLFKFFKGIRVLMYRKGTGPEIGNTHHISDAMKSKPNLDSSAK